MRSWKIVEESADLNIDSKDSIGDRSGDVQGMDFAMRWTPLQKISSGALLLIVVTIVTYANALVLSAAARNLLSRGDNGAMASITYTYFAQSAAASILFSGIIGSYFALRKSLDPCIIFNYIRKHFGSNVL